MRLSRALERMLAGVVPRRRSRGDAPDAPAGRGYVERIHQSPTSLEVEGWLGVAGQRIDEYRLDLDGTAVARATPQHRADVLEVFPTLSDAGATGFRFIAEPPPDLAGGWTTYDVVGLSGDQAVARIRLRYRPDFRDGLADPPAELRYRVTRCEDLAVYWLGGLQTFGEFCGGIERYWEPAEVRRLLDWGCGCGRVTSLFLKYLPAVEVHGCDIDPEAIAWCRANLRSGHFAATDPGPPTPYPDGYFDVVTAYSVLTHLTQPLQRSWLEEMDRILAPGGLFLGSVHGQFAASFVGDPEILRDLETRGISDATPDATLSGLAPNGYYRCTYQRRNHTVREFSQVLRVLDYVPQGMTNFQDLVILRKPG